MRLYPEEVPDRAPEALKVVDRPSPKVVVAGEREAAGILEPTHESRDVGAADVFGRGLPEQVALGDPSQWPFSRHPRLPDAGENGLIEPELLGDPPVQGEPVFITGMLRLKERDVPLDCLKQL